jgi:hypothetical protein
VAAATLAPFGGPAASAAPFTQAYPFTGSPAGTAGWVALDTPSPNPWYTSSIGTGGMRMAPTGNGGQVYDNAYRSGFQVDAPAGATITRAVLSDVDARQEDRQRTRINLLPQPHTDVLNGSEPWGKSTTLDGDTLTGTIALTPAPGGTATGLQIRHFPVACGNADLSQPPCAPVPSTTGAHANIGGVTLTLDDPSGPVAGLAGPAGGWTNASTAQVNASGSDPQSGVARLSVQVRSGSATRTETLGTWSQDTTGATLPGRATARNADASIALPRTGSATITTIARNGADVDAASAPITVQVDRVASRITWPKVLQGGQTATVRDAESGIGALAVTLDDRPVATQCAPGAKQCKVKIPTSADGALRITATDVAGNRTSERRAVVPRPRSGPGADGGGAKDRPRKSPRKPGSRKPSASYCKRHPAAKVCRSGPDGGRGKRPKDARDRRAPRGTKISRARTRAGKPGGRACRVRRLALSGAGSFAIGVECRGDKVLGRGDTFTGSCQGKKNSKPYRNCRYQVQLLRPHGKTSGSYCAIVPLESSNAHPSTPKGPGRAPKGRKNAPYFKARKSACNDEIRKICVASFRDLPKNRVARFKQECNHPRRYYLPLAATAAIINGKKDNAAPVNLNEAYLAQKGNKLPVCAGVNPMAGRPKRGTNPAGPGGAAATSVTCDRSMVITKAKRLGWRWLTKDGKYVMASLNRLDEAAFGGARWAFIPVEAIIGPNPPASVPERAKLLCQTGQKPGEPPPRITIAGRAESPIEFANWGNVQVCNAKNE